MTNGSLEQQDEDDPSMLVLVTPRVQRLVGMIIASMPVLAVGPIMRFMQGDGYSPFIGVLVGLLLMLFTALLRRWLAVLLGAEWVVRSEWHRRMTAEMAETSTWPGVLVAIAATTITLLGFALIVTPRLDNIEIDVWLLSLVLIAMTGVRIRVARHILSRALQVPARNEDQAQRYRALKRYFRRRLLAGYLVCVTAALIGIAVGMRFDRLTRVLVYVVAVLAFIGFCAFLRLLWLAFRRESSGRIPLRLSALHLRTFFLLWGLLAIAVPMAILGGGLIIAETMGLPQRTLAFVSGFISEALDIPEYTDACIVGYGVYCLFAIDLMMSALVGLYAGVYLFVNPVLGFPEGVVMGTRAGANQLPGPR
jgi:hypothetical protein